MGDGSGSGRVNRLRGRLCFRCAGFKHLVVLLLILLLWLMMLLVVALYSSATASAVVVAVFAVLPVMLPAASRAACIQCELVCGTGSGIRGVNDSR